MAGTVRQTILKGSTAEWESYNPVLLNGEMGYELKEDGNWACKIGDGQKRWTQLDYFLNQYVTAEEMERISKEASTMVKEVQDLVNTIPSDYTALSNQVSSLSGEIDTLNAGGLVIKDDVVVENVQDWLDAHPEATTTVQDGAITEPKISADFLRKIKNEYITPQMFGAVGDGVTDDTEAFNIMLANDINTIIIPKGRYFIKNVEIPSNRTIFGARGAVIVSETDNDNHKGAFVANNTSNILLDGLTYECTGNSRLQYGGLVRGDKSSNVVLTNCYAKNVEYLASFQNCTNLEIYNNTAVNDDSFNGFSGFFFGNCSDCNIHGNTILGNFHDGMISYFGASTKGKIWNNLVDSCYNGNYFEWQGITVDSGCTQTEVYENTVKHCFYGIDIKTLSDNVGCRNNTLYANKVGIAVREGEISQGDIMSRCQLVSNNIYLNDKNIKSTYKFYSKYNVVGILVESETPVIIRGNKITPVEKGVANCCLMSVAGDLSVDENKRDGCIISDNVLLGFAFEQNALKIISSNSTVFRFNNIENVIISNNKINLHYAKSQTTKFIDGTIKSFVITYNIIFARNNLDIIANNTLFAYNVCPTRSLVSAFEATILYKNICTNNVNFKSLNVVTGAMIAKEPILLHGVNGSSIVSINFEYILNTTRCESKATIYITSNKISTISTDNDTDDSFNISADYDSANKTLELTPVFGESLGQFSIYTCKYF